MRRDDFGGPILGRYVDDRFAQGVFRLDPRVYSDPELFELEMKHIFERTWIFLAIESQIRNLRDRRARVAKLGASIRREWVSRLPAAATLWRP